MTDVTSDFQSLVKDQPSYFKQSASLPAISKPSVINDTFNKESIQLWKHLQELGYLVSNVEPLYLDEKAMSTTEKDDFDSEIRYQLQQYLEKLKFLEKYEIQRKESVQKKHASLSFSNIFRGDSSQNENQQSFEAGVIAHRNGVLRSLQLKLMELGEKMSKLQIRRLVLQKGALAIDFEQARKTAFMHSDMVHDFNDVPSVEEKETAISDNDIAPLADVHLSPIIETTREEVREYEQTMQQLTQEQIQALQDDHEDILNFKNQQLHEVETLNKTIMGIANLQNELAIHLQSQSDTINNIMDNHDTVQVDISQANKNLKKAGRAAGYSAKMVSTMAIVFGLLILVMDFIN